MGAQGRQGLGQDTPRPGSRQGLPEAEVGQGLCQNWKPLQHLLLQRLWLRLLPRRPGNGFVLQKQTLWAQPSLLPPASS